MEKFYWDSFDCQIQCEEVYFCFDDDDDDSDDDDDEWNIGWEK